MKKHHLITYLLFFLGIFSQIGEANSLTLERQCHVPKKPDLLLYYIPGCPYCQKVLLHLKKMQKTLPMKNIQNDSEGREDLLSLGGNTQVPCLIIDEEALYESQDIIKWLSKNKHHLEPN